MLIQLQGSPEYMRGSKA